MIIAGTKPNTTWIIIYHDSKVQEFKVAEMNFTLLTRNTNFQVANHDVCFWHCANPPNQTQTCTNQTNPYTPQRTTNDLQRHTDRHATLLNSQSHKIRPFYRNFSSIPFSPSSASTPHLSAPSTNTFLSNTGLLQNHPDLLSRKPQTFTPRPHPSMPFTLRPSPLRFTTCRTARPVLDCSIVLCHVKAPL